jgi:hypothetical protein
VERRYRGLPPLPDTPVLYPLTAKAGALLNGEAALTGHAPQADRQEMTA